MTEPKFGDRVLVYPAHDKIQVDGVYGRYLPKDGAEVIWSEWYFRRWRDGSLRVSLITSLEEDAN